MDLQHLPTLIIFAPTIGAVLLMLMPKDNEDGLRYTALTVTIALENLTSAMATSAGISERGSVAAKTRAWASPPSTTSRRGVA